MKYRVTDLRPGADNFFDEFVNNARSPEDAVRQAFGLNVVRNGAKANLVALVHRERVGQVDLSVDLFARPS